jgi:hypothetical protein
MGTSRRRLLIVQSRDDCEFAARVRDELWRPARKRWPQTPAGA